MTDHSELTVDPPKSFEAYSWLDSPFKEVVEPPTVDSLLTPKVP